MMQEGQISLGLQVRKGHGFYQLRRAVICGLLQAPNAQLHLPAPLPDVPKEEIYLKLAGPLRSVLLTRFSNLLEGCITALNHRAEMLPKPHYYMTGLVFKEMVTPCGQTEGCAARKKVPRRPM